jgi:hypothetical protein
MTITENKLRQIVRQELLNLLEGRVPMEDLAIFYKLLENLQYFPLPNEKEQESILNLTTIDLQLTELIEKIKFDVDQIINKKTSLDEGLLDTLSDYFGKEKEPKPEVYTKTDLTIAVDGIKEKLAELEEIIDFGRRSLGSSKYLKYHDSDVKPILDQLRNRLKVITQSNVAYPASEAELELPKRTLLKRQKRGQQ